jgi:hypothetical protein
VVAAPLGRIDLSLAASGYGYSGIAITNYFGWPVRV